MRFEANLSMMFPELEPALRFQAARKAGFTACEYLRPYSHTVAEMKQWLIPGADPLFKVTIVKPGAEWEQLSTADLDEQVIATPAIAGDRLFVRTDGTLYCFGGKQ